MRIDTLIVAIVCLAAGFLAGVLYTDKATAPTSAGSPPVTSAPAVDLRRQVAELEKVTAAQPQNRTAWVALGNAYFDTDQAMPAVEAYDRALALDPKDPDVLVDQAIMYRELGWFDRAMDNFNRALEINPGHRNALYNLGIVQRSDLNDFPAAAKTWRRLLEVAPDLPNAEQLRQQIEALEKHPPMPKN